MGRGHFRLRRPHGRPTVRRRALCTLLALAAAALPAAAAAQVATATADARAAILDQGTMVKESDIDFGQIVRPVGMGTVVLAPTSTPTCTTTGGLIRSGPCTAAAWAVMARAQGQPRVRIRELNGGVVTLTNPGGATMIMNNLTIGVTAMTVTNGAGGWNFGRWLITSASEIGRFRIGGTLRVNAAQAAGQYNGTLVIEVEFN